MIASAGNLTEKFRWSSFHAIVLRLPVRYRFVCMSDQNEIPPKQNYKWPWFVLAAVILFFVLAVVWVGFAVLREKQERDFNAPLPSSPAH
jgi:bacteriorhodopsin